MVWASAAEPPSPLVPYIAAALEQVSAGVPLAHYGFPAP
jgi:hypothetical protein